MLAHDLGIVIFLSGRQDLGVSQLGQYGRWGQARYKGKINGEGDLFGANNARPF